MLLKIVLDEVQLVTPQDMSTTPKRVMSATHIPWRYFTLLYVNIPILREYSNQVQFIVHDMKA